MTEEDRELWMYAASNRARIDYIDHELSTVRDHVHDMRSEVEAVKALATQVGRLAENVDELAGEVATVSRRALARPSQGALSVFGQYIGLVIAIVALLVAAFR